jgi:AraC-like DNA-binding protein
MRAHLYRSLLNPEMVENMYQEIMAKFIVEKKYRDADYNAQKLADELNTNTRYISAVINLRYQDNYSQMVNEFRIKDAMYLLKDKHSQKMTMEEIALTVGFSNRQSFYAAFYKRLGITPREYRQKNMAQIETQLNDRRKRLKESRAKKKQDN